MGSTLIPRVAFTAAVVAAGITLVNLTGVYVVRVAATIGGAL